MSVHGIQKNTKHNNAPAEPTERAVVERQSQQAHVVGVEHAVREADALPGRDERGRAAAHLAKQVGDQVDALVFVFFCWWLRCVLCV